MLHFWNKWDFDIDLCKFFLIKGSYKLIMTQAVQDGEALIQNYFADYLCSRTLCFVPMMLRYNYLILHFTKVCNDHFWSGDIRVCENPSHGFLNNRWWSSMAVLSRKGHFKVFSQVTEENIWYLLYCCYQLTVKKRAALI